jgi:beta-N-acetylhexosaminidase
MRDAGMVAVAKHFPGHGAVVPDSHLHLPVDRREFGDVLDDMQPYDVLSRNRAIGAVMMAHIVYSETDSMPAGFSSYWIGNQLRGQLGFDGAVFCDDLSMEAAAPYGSVPKRAALALAAGCDMVLVCNDRHAASATVASLSEYSKPTSLVRLARLHGTGHELRESLLASEAWQEATDLLQHWSDRPVLQLDA